MEVKEKNKILEGFFSIRHRKRGDIDVSHLQNDKNNRYLKRA